MVQASASISTATGVWDMKENPLKKGVQYLKASSDEIQAQYSTAASRSLHLTGISGVGNIFLGLGKIISGVLSLSVFVCVNGCYTLGMVLARYCALAGVLRGKDEKSQYRFYRWSGMILIGARLCKEEKLKKVILILVPPDGKLHHQMFGTNIINKIWPI